MSHRVIARLDIKGPNLVKGIHLEGLRVLGKPYKFAKEYFENSADELMYVDVVASLYGRNSLHELVSKMAKETFIPLTVAGGLRTLDDIRAVLRAGADKVSLNTAAIKNPQIIKEAAREFGSSTIIVTIEAIQNPPGEYLAYVDNGRDHTGVEVEKWAKEVAELGAGEIVITSVDQEGTGMGYDLDLIKMVSSKVGIPVIAHGGAGKVNHLKDAINAGADAVAVSSMLHYDFINRHSSDEDYEIEGNIEFLKSGRQFSRIEAMPLPEIKEKLHASGIECRH